MKRGREYHSCRKNIKTGEKNIKWGKEEGGLFAKENKDFKKWVWGKISSCRELYTPLLLWLILSRAKVFWSVVYLRTPGFVRSCPLAGSA